MKTLLERIEKLDEFAEAEALESLKDVAKLIKAGRLESACNCLQEIINQLS